MPFPPFMQVGLDKVLQTSVNLDAIVNNAGSLSKLGSILHKHFCTPAQHLLPAYRSAYQDTLKAVRFALSPPYVPLHSKIIKDFQQDVKTAFLPAFPHTPLYKALSKECLSLEKQLLFSQASLQVGTKQAFEADLAALVGAKTLPNLTDLILEDVQSHTEISAELLELLRLEDLLGCGIWHFLRADKQLSLLIAALQQEQVFQRVIKIDENVVEILDLVRNIHRFAEKAGSYYVDGENINVLTEEQRQLDIQQEESWDVAIGIDFGENFSGYAYCFPSYSTTGAIYKNTDWGTLVGQKYHYIKTPTCLLYRGDRLDSWGYKAKQRLIELKKWGETNRYYFFEKFKSELYYRNKVDKHEKPYLENNGKCFSLVDLVADYLREIRLIALKDIESHTGNILDETQIRWCLAIPDFWDNTAKRLMEQSAQKAGILKDDYWNNKNFIFASEPEIMATYCLHVTSNELGIVEDKTNHIMMIADCNDNGIRLTAHKIIREQYHGFLQEVVPRLEATDGYGSKDIDRNFLDYLSRILEGGAIEKFEKDYPEAYVQMMEDWEILKYGFDPSDFERYNFRIPSELHNLLQKHFPNVLRELATKQSGNSFHLYLTREVMEKDIFRSVINNILIKLENTFKQINGRCEYLCLLGNFSRLPFLQQQVKKTFQAQVERKILIFGEPGKSMMVGAAAFACDPSIIRENK